MSSQLNHRQAAHIDKRNLFDGNPLQYKRFIKNFDSYTTEGVINMSICLNMLISFCTADMRNSRLAPLKLALSRHDEFWK